MGRRKAPHWVRDHYVLHVEAGELWARYACRHCGWDFEFQTSDARVTAQWLHLADHLLLGHKVTFRHGVGEALRT